MKSQYYYRRNLPHYQPPFSSFFITMGLTNSLPASIVRRLQEERKTFEKLIQCDAKVPDDFQQKYESHKRYFARFDQLLDSSTTGPLWLRDEKIASIVREALHHRDGKEYRLDAYSIMPNHVHFVLTVERDDISLYRILHSLKRHTARHANLILGRSGQFWKRESYDHVVRDGSEFSRIIQYVIMNPVKAGLVKEWQQWQWTYIRTELFRSE